MKKIICKAMGGVCDTEITGETADELMANGKQHVHDAADGGDEAHKEVIERMKSMSKEGHDKWAEDFTNKFETLEDA